MGIRDTREHYNQYMRKYHLERYHRIRNEAIQELGGKCFICGSVKKLQIDHIDPKDKKFEVSLFLSVSLEIFRKELKKCQLLCHVCHNKKTLKEMGLREAKGSHGTVSTYRYCHCELCKQAKREWAKKYYRTHKRVTINGKRIIMPL